MKKVTAVLLAFSLVFAGLTTTTYAATRKKITTVSLEISADIQVGEEVDVGKVEVESSGSKYSIDGCQFENDGFEWEETDIPKLKVTLKADSDSYFAMTSASSVRLKGSGAKYVSASKLDSSETLIVTMTLSPLKEQVGSIASADWTSVGVAGWSAAPGAGSYEVRLHKNGSPFGSVQTVTETTMDFSNMLIRSGGYTFKVRGVNSHNSENKGRWKESGSVYVDEDMAARYRETGGAKWIQDEAGWWHQNGDGSYTSNNWQFIGGNWYFFNEQGYMMTGWVLWNNQWYFCNQDGTMAVSTVTPDGFTVNENGVCQ